MRRLLLLGVLLSLTGTANADDVIETCDLYTSMAAVYMIRINDGKSVLEMLTALDKSYESDPDTTYQDLFRASLELALRFNYLNTGKSRAGYEFVKKNGMAACLEAGGPHAIIWPKNT